MTSEKLVSIMSGSEVTITVEQAKSIVDSLILLEALEAGGVDNWEWYYESTKHLY